ncbi:MAG: hypothetical protein EZS28_021469 [Streblomastix strix]|uniref:Uncharacterized protein n=1 Tax=Streblomastix strix TaxID=222440 RepID=A0A5J4VKM2_9EUKA|nr:MAG: hypothetical protein EZS28_021469 [Streblomastix strix]
MMITYQLQKYKQNLRRLYSPYVSSESLRNLRYTQLLGTKSIETKQIFYAFLRKLTIRLNNKRQEEHEIQRSVLIQHCSLGLIVYIGVIGQSLIILQTFWQFDGQPADKRRISLWLNSLLREIGIRGAIAYSFTNAASTELARQVLETTKLNTFTHHSVFSRNGNNYDIHAANAGINDIASQLVGSHGQSYATQIISQQRGGAIKRSDISILPDCYLQHSGNNTLSRSSIAQPLALPFDETLPVGRGIEPTDNTRARSDIIYIDQYDNDDMSRQQDQWSSWNTNDLEHRRSLNKDKQQQ